MRISFVIYPIKNLISLFLLLLSTWLFMGTCYFHEVHDVCTRINSISYVLCHSAPQFSSWKRGKKQQCYIRSILLADNHLFSFFSSVALQLIPSPLFVWPKLSINLLFEHVCVFLLSLADISLSILLVEINVHSALIQHVFLEILFIICFVWNYLIFILCTCCMT